MLDLNLMVTAEPNFFIPQFFLTKKKKNLHSNRIRLSYQKQIFRSV